jgi:tetratricopeptide (TPR) repeat protein
MFSVYAHSAEWYENYGKAQKEIDRGKCAEGVPLILEALKVKPKSDLKARPYGTFTLEYIPYFYLAKCAVESGDYESAVKYTKAAEAGSVFSSSKATEYESIKAKFQSMQKPKTQPQQTPPAQEVTPPSQNPPQKIETVPPPKTETPPPVQKVQPPKKDTSAEMVQRYLNEAKASLRRGDLEEARNAANRVLALDSDNSEAQSILSDVTRREKVASQREELQKGLDSVRSSIRAGNLDLAEAQILTLKSQYPTDNSVNSVYQEIQSKKQQLQGKTQQADLNRLIEKQVLSAYYSGEYPAAIQLAEGNLKDNPNSWRLYFYLGCSYTALSLLENRDKDERLQRARDSFRKAKTLAGSISIPPYISPKIVEVFRNS